MPDLRIAWVCPEPHYIGALIDDLEMDGVEVELFRYAVQAIEELKAKKYPLIVADLDIAPGTSDYSEHPNLEEIMSRSEQLFYYEVGLYLIKRLRDEDSANKGTPVYVAATYLPSKDNAFPAAKRTSLEAGATKYFCLLDISPDGFTAEILKELRISPQCPSPSP